jgi:hypothetical protein
MPSTLTLQDQAPKPDDPNAPPLPKPRPAPAAGQLSLAAPPATAAPAPTIAAPAQPVDRVALATSAYDSFAKAQEPAYQKSLDQATSQAAGLGQLGSGQWRSALRDQATQHQLTLDTQRDALLNKAIEGSVADASTAYQQALSGSQQNLAGELGRGNLTIAQQNADTAKTGTVGSLGVQQGQLELAKTAQATGADQTQQQIDLAKKTADINAAYQAGTLTLAQKDQALRELANSQQNTLATGQLTLAQQQAGVQNAIAAAGLTGIYNGTQTIQAKSQAIQDAIAQGRLTVEQGQLALAQLTEKDSNANATAQLAEQTAARLQQNSQFNASLAQSAEQFKGSLAENARQFGLSQSQQLALAKLNDATANRSIDASTAQGKNQLLLQLAQILGGPTGTLNPDALAEIARSFGIVVPSTLTLGGGPSGPAGSGGGGSGSSGGGTPGTTPTTSTTTK